MKQFRYELHDEFGMLRGFDSKWDAYNLARDDKTMWVIHNPQIKVNRFREALERLGECLI